MRYALKIAYDGTRFSGSQRQPEVRTVDGECIFVLKKNKAIPGPREARFQSASRTDAGVSAVGNVIALDTEMGKRALLGAFNSASRDVWAWAVASVPETFSPRKAAQRWYRYHLPEGLDVERARAAARLFIGRHDFRRFTRARMNTIRTLDSVDVTREGDFLCLDVRGQSFLWGMVRRIAAAIQLHCEGETSLQEIQSALAGGKADFGLSPPEPLILMDVAYDFDFEVVPLGKVAERILEPLRKSHLDVVRWRLIAGRLGLAGR